MTFKSTHTDETLEVGDVVAFNDDNVTRHYRKGDLVRLTTVGADGWVDFEQVCVADPRATDTTRWPAGWFTKRNGLVAWQTAVAAGETISSFADWSRLAAVREYSAGLPVCITVDHATGVVTFDVDLSEASDLDTPDQGGHVDDDESLVSEATAKVGQHFTFTVETRNIEA